MYVLLGLPKPREGEEGHVAHGYPGHSVGGEE